MKRGQRHSEETKKKISHKTKEAMKNPKIKSKVLKTAFKKGNKPWNVGMNGIRLSPKSEFKEGENIGERNPSWKGGIQRPKNDCTHIWCGANRRKRRPRFNYEKHYGKIPKSHVIYHIDGDKDNDKISNLKAISRAELLELNRINRR